MGGRFGKGVGGKEKASKGRFAWKNRFVNLPLMDTDLRPVFSRKFCFCPEFRKATHTQHFKLRIKLLLGRRVIDAQGGTCQNFDRDVRPTFLGLKFDQILFFCVGKFFAIFLGFAKFPLFFWVWQISSYFLGLPIFVSHFNPLHEEHTVLKNIKS